MARILARVAGAGVGLRRAARAPWSRRSLSAMAKGLPPRSLGAAGSAALRKKEKTVNYFSQLCVQPFFLGHRLQFLIEKSFFLGFDVGLGAQSTRISAG